MKSSCIPNLFHTQTVHTHTHTHTHTSPHSHSHPPPPHHHPLILTPSPITPSPPHPLTPAQQVPLTTSNIETILSTLLYDGRAEVVLVPSTSEGEGPQKLYRATRPVLPSTGFNRIPCGVCPVSVWGVPGECVEVCPVSVWGVPGECVEVCPVSVWRCAW